MTTTVGRRVGSYAEITQPGDYWGPVEGYTGNSRPAVFFLLPNAHEDGAPPEQRRVHHVCGYDGTFNEHPDGSLSVSLPISVWPHWIGCLDPEHHWKDLRASSEPTDQSAPHDFQRRGWRFWL